MLQATWCSDVPQWKGARHCMLHVWAWRGQEDFMRPLFTPLQAKATENAAAPSTKPLNADLLQ